MQVPDALSRRLHTTVEPGTNLSPLLRLTDKDDNHRLEITINNKTKVLLTLKTKTIVIADLQTPDQFDYSPVHLSKLTYFHQWNIACISGGFQQFSDLPE